MEQQSLRLPEADSGFVLDEFKAWWNAISPEDRVEFTLTYQGTTVLAQFVYLLDKWIIGGGKWNRADLGQIVEAYAVSHQCNATTARANFKDALEHDAVQAILSRLTYRETLSGTMRITHKHHRLVENVLDKALDAAASQDLSAGATYDEDGKLVSNGATNAIKLVQMAMKGAEGIATQSQATAASARAERTRNAMVNARAAAEAATGSKDPSEDELIVFFKNVRDRLGRHRFAELLSHSDLPELDSGGRALSSQQGDSQPG